MPKAQDLLMDGEVFDPNKPGIALSSIQKLLDSKPPNEVYSVDKLHEIGGMGKNSIYRFSRDVRYAKYVYRGARQENYFGNPKAIALLRSKLEGK